MPSKEIDLRFEPRCKVSVVYVLPLLPAFTLGCP